MLDCHCHLDRIPQPERVAFEAAARGVFIVAMTNLPSHFEAGFARVRALKRVRLALGLHPLAAADHSRELEWFERRLPSTTFVGEVGLDFSRHGKATADRQLQTFRRVIELTAGKGKVVSIHSRGAERAVLEVLQEYRSGAAIFHWFTGPAVILDRVVESGHYLSVNPAMIDSPKGRTIVSRIPRNRILTETDSPHVKMQRGRPAMPWDVEHVESWLAGEWGCSIDDVRAQVWQNFTGLVTAGRAEL